MSIVQLYLEMEVKDAHALKAALPSLVEKSQRDDGVLSYQFFLSEDEARFFGFEVYRDAAALGAHMQDIGEELGALMESVNPGTTMVGGDVPDALKEGFAAFGPTYLQHVTGFPRS